MPRTRLPVSLTSGEKKWTSVDAGVALELLAESGLSVPAFAEREGIDPQRLYFWMRRLGKPRRPAVAKFVEVTPRVAANVEVVLQNGRILRVPTSIDAAALRDLIAVLEESAC